MNLREQIMEFIAKYIAWIGWVTLGMIGMFSADLLRNRKFTIWYVLGSTGTAIFVGYVGGSYIIENYPTKASILIPLITLVSNNLVSAIMSIDYKALLEKDWKGAFEKLMRKSD